MAQNRIDSAYGFSAPLLTVPKATVIAKIAPGVGTTGYALGQLWLNVLTGNLYYLSALAAGAATWTLIEAGGAAGAFTTLTSTGATTLATGGASANTFGNATAGTTLNLITGAGLPVTSAQGFTATTGNITATTGDIVVTLATHGVTLPGGQQVISRATTPNGVVTAVKGSLCLVANGSGANDRAFINTDGATAWTAIVTVA